MRRSSVPSELSETDILRQYINSRAQQDLLNKFLKNIKKAMKEQAERHLPKSLENAQFLQITRPQVFLSYAWEAANTPQLDYLHHFLKRLSADLSAAGLKPWLDIEKMTGNIDGQMRSGIKASQYVLLMGTNRYAERTTADSKTNVRKELDFTLEESKKSVDFLLPLMLEGDYGTTFPHLGGYLIRDCRPWNSLTEDQWASSENYRQYIKNLTECKPLGILPCLLGLNRSDDYTQYREACSKAYRQNQEMLMLELELLQIKGNPAEQKYRLSQSTQILIPRPKLDTKGLEETLEKLLRLVAEGEQDEAERLISQNNNLLQLAGTVKDLSGREFKQITAFQYALWAGDWNMWNMIQKYLPKNIAAEQLEIFESEGTSHGKRFSLQSLMDALQIFVDKAEREWNYDSRAKEHWQKKVGGAQRQLPANMVNQYCQGDRTFNPCPNFNEAKLARTRVIEVWGQATSSWVTEDWFKAKYSGGHIGDAFAIVRCDLQRTAQQLTVDPNYKDWIMRSVRADLMAIQSLEKTLVEKFELLSSQLKSSSFQFV